jgi:predicted CoA-binding protein
MTECALPENNPADAEIGQILQQAKTIAVVGISHKEDRDSHKVAKYLQEHGYKIIPVNPKYTEVLGEKCYPSLQDVPERIDIADIFRNLGAIPGIVEEAIAAGVGTVWMQLGLAHNEAARKAEAAGLRVVMNKCTKIEHYRLRQGVME